MHFGVAVIGIAIAISVTNCLECGMVPEGISSRKNVIDADRYMIYIPGNPKTYTPGQKYNVILKVNTNKLPQKQFKQFSLTLVSDGYPGKFEVESNPQVLIEFNSRCQHTVREHSLLPKWEVQVYWIAPPKNSGCVTIKATVVESRESWFSEDGPLTKVLCEDNGIDENAKPPLLDKCCACSEAKYEMAFEGRWTRNTHPRHFPTDIWSTKFSDIIGTSHSKSSSFWNDLDVASTAMREFAETGSTHSVEEEIKKLGTNIRTIIKARGLQHPNITESSYAVFRVDSNNHLLTLASKITPSPDWFAGVANFELCTPECTWIESYTYNLYPMDAGTNDGIQYCSADPSLSSRKMIMPITPNNPNDPNSPFYDEKGEPMNPVAKLHLTRQRVYDKPCDSNEEKNACAVSEWSDWTPCSVTCGLGEKTKSRHYLEEEKATHCNVELEQKQSCQGKPKYCKKGLHRIKPKKLKEEVQVEIAENSEEVKPKKKIHKNKMKNQKKNKKKKVSGESKSEEQPENISEQLAIEVGGVGSWRKVNKGKKASSEEKDFKEEKDSKNEEGSEEEKDLKSEKDSNEEKDSKSKRDSKEEKNSKSEKDSKEEKDTKEEKNSSAEKKSLEENNSKGDNDSEEKTDSKQEKSIERKNSEEKKDSKEESNSTEGNSSERKKSSEEINPKDEKASGEKKDSKEENDSKQKKDSQSGNDSEKNSNEDEDSPEKKDAKNEKDSKDENSSAEGTNSKNESNSQEDSSRDVKSSGEEKGTNEEEDSEEGKDSEQKSENSKASSEEQFTKPKRAKNKKKPKNSRELTEEKPCAVGKWSIWSTCSASCGIGTKTRDRNLIHPENARRCDVELQENRNCTGPKEKCSEEEETKCNNTNWGTWSSCSVSCGTGIKRRVRLPMEKSKNSEDEDDDSNDNEEHCSTSEIVNCRIPCNGSTKGESFLIDQAADGFVVNCKTSNWSIWGKCDTSDSPCGKGNRKRYRNIMWQAENGGKACPKSLIQFKTCYVECTTSGEIEQRHSSEEVMKKPECTMTGWTDFTPCSSICGASTMQCKTRKILHKPKGAICPPRVDCKPCDVPAGCSPDGR